MSNVSSSICVFLILAGVAGVVLAYIIHSIRQQQTNNYMRLNRRPCLISRKERSVSLIVFCQRAIQSTLSSENCGS